MRRLLFHIKSSPLSIAAVAAALSLFLLVFVPLSNTAAGENRPWQTGLVGYEFWVELDPMVREGADYPLSNEEAVRRGLEEARRIISGMIYGYTFVYEPSDRSREIEEVFELESAAEIPFGDKRLSVRQSRLDGRRVVMTADYELAPHQIDRLRSWSSSAVPQATGRGAAGIYDGYMQKFTALRRACKEAIRAYHRKRTGAKPRRIEGDLVLAGPPRFYLQAGEYHAVVKIRLLTRKVEAYRHF